jgi:hypothetical protein
MDFARLVSFYHSCGGFYISNILIILSFQCTLYYMCAMALTGADFAVLASNTVYLIGSINFLQWCVIRDAGDGASCGNVPFGSSSFFQCLCLCNQPPFGSPSYLIHCPCLCNPTTATHIAGSSSSACCR